MYKVSALSWKVNIFLKLNWFSKIELLEAFFLSAMARVIILKAPFKKYKKHLGIYNEETSYEINLNDYKTIKRIAWTINTISKYTPWESKCLVQAMTAQRMLNRRKLSSTLYLGVNKAKDNSMQAHAWLRCGQLIVTGGYNKKEFKEVARFASKV
jgi:hypothetical protein